MSNSVIITMKVFRTKGTIYFRKRMKLNMKKLIMGIALIISAVSLNSQTDLRLQINQGNQLEDQQCVNLSITNWSDDQVNLSSQNYRMYYSADNLKLMEQSLKSSLQEDLYQLKLVQHVDGVDASGRGSLEFENNLGFINFSIVHTNFKQKGVPITGNALEIAQMCFVVNDFEKDIQVVLAREEMTSTYGRAYVELSTHNSENTLGTTSISQYKDLIIR